MIRNITLVLLMVFICIMGVQLHEGLLSHFWSPQSSNHLSQHGLHHYDLEARFVEKDNTLQVIQRTTYFNKHSKDFETIYFHLYPNAYGDKENLPFPSDEMEFAYPKGFEPGNIEIKNVKVQGKQVKYDVEGQQKTILKIDLPEVLKSQGEVTLYFEYEVKIPPSASRFGYGETTYNLGNWYPVAAVYDDEGWNLDPYYAIGDPFYSEVSNYKVSLTLPKEYQLATTGDIVNTQKTKGQKKEKTWTVQANGVRDFAWVMSKDFKILRDKAGDTDIHVYYGENQQGKKALEVAKDSIDIFNKSFGIYPYKQFSVVASDFYIGGMEYPNLVYIDKNVFAMDTTLMLEYIIAHETAHQWWYGIVGNNQVKEPWIDEALTEYSTILYFREKYGEEIGMRVFKTMVVDDYTRIKDKLPGKKEIIARSVDEFKDNREYSGLVYSKGAIMFYQLEKEIGKENMLSILQYYMGENQFTNVQGKDIKSITKAVTGKDYQKFFERWLGK